MNYSKKLLGKELQDLKYADIEQFFTNPKEESNKSEYKSYDSRGSIEEKYKGIYKGVCGMLNSEGGILIWGAPKGKKVPNLKEKVFEGALSPIQEVIEKDALINKISDNITPTPNSVKAEIIENNGDRVIVFEIDKSVYAPHQTDNTYYMRLDGQSRPAPHHYIEALFKQIRYPELGGYLKFQELKSDGQYYYLKTQIVVINHSSILNEEDVSFRLTCINGIMMDQDHTKLSLQGHQLYVKDFANLLHYGGVPYYDLTFCYAPNNLVKDNFDSKISLTFGGRKSPMKESSYTINLSNLYPANINDIVKNKEENKLMYEVGIDKGSESEKVDILLGRN